VFAAGWVTVGCAESVREPGDALVAEVAGRSVLVNLGQDPSQPVRVGGPLADHLGDLPERLSGYRLDEWRLARTRFIWLFPNVAVNVLPNHLFMIHTIPLAPGRTRETTYLLTRPDVAEDPDAQETIDGVADFWDGVNREDIAIVERVQRGPASTPFPGGPMCYRFEEPVHRFQNMIADRMTGVDRVPVGDDEAEPPRAGLKVGRDGPDVSRG
jgi:phenylpropionate dioxygenase-like ring-hydroxylating dioxygenase large terminal subunit